MFAKLFLRAFAIHKNACDLYTVHPNLWITCSDWNISWICFLFFSFSWKWICFFATQQKSSEVCQESTGNLWLIRLVSHGFQQKLYRSFHPFSTLSCNKVGNFHWCQTCLFPAFLVLNLWNFSLFCSFFQCLRRYLSWQGSAGSGSNLEVFSFCNKSSTTSNLTKAACHNTGPRRFNRSAQERSSVAKGLARWKEWFSAMANCSAVEGCWKRSRSSCLNQLEPNVLAANWRQGNKIHHEDMVSLNMLNVSSCLCKWDNFQEFITLILCMESHLTHGISGSQ